MASALDTIPAELRRELVKLRKNQGFTLTKLEASPQLLSLCRCDRTSVSVAAAILLDAVRSQDSVRDRDALLNAWGVDINDPAVDLDERRGAFGVLCHRSRAAVKLWEDRATAELYQTLLRRFSGGYECALVDAYELVIVENRQCNEYYEARDLIALEDGVDSFSYRISSSAVVEPLTPEAWEADVVDQGSTLYLIRFARPLHQGEPLRWEFRVHETSPRPESGEVDYAEQVFGPTTLHYRLDVQFRGEQPDVCWYFDQEPIELARAGRYREDEVLTPDREGLVSKDFHFLSGAAPSGIAWRWT